MSKLLDTLLNDLNSIKFFSRLIQVPLRQITLYIICSNASIAEVIIMGYAGGGYGYGSGAGFALIVVLFILLIIVGAAYVY